MKRNHYTSPEIDYKELLALDVITLSNPSDLDLEDSELVEDNIINW